MTRGDYVIIKGKKVDRKWLVNLLSRPPTKEEFATIQSLKDVFDIVFRHWIWYQRSRSAKRLHRFTELSEEYSFPRVEERGLTAAGYVSSFLDKLKKGAEVQVKKPEELHPLLDPKKIKELEKHELVAKAVNAAKGFPESELDMWGRLALVMFAVGLAEDIKHATTEHIHNAILRGLPEDLADWIIEQARKEGALLEEEKPPEKPPTPALAKALEEIEVPAGLPALAYKIKNMVYVLANLFQHPEDETKINVEGIRATYDMLGKRTALLELFKDVLEVWEKDIREGREPTPINKIILERLKSVLTQHPEIKGDLTKIVQSAERLEQLSDERIIQHVVDAYKSMGIRLSPKEIKELHKILDTLHTMERKKIWSEVDMGAEVSERATILEYWRRYLERLGITPRPSNPEEARKVIEKIMEAAASHMEQRLESMKGWEIVKKYPEVYNKLFAEAEKIIEASKSVRSFKELTDLLHRLREIDPVHGSSFANYLFTAALDGALRKIAEEGKNVFLLSRYSKDAGAVHAGTLLSAAEMLGFSKVTSLPPVLAGMEEMRRELAEKKTELENVREKVSALDSMVRSVHSRVSGLLEAPIELGPHYPGGLVKRTFEQAFKEMQGLVPRERIRPKK